MKCAYHLGILLALTTQRRLLRYTAKQKGMTLNEYGSSIARIALCSAKVDDAGMGKKYDPIDKNPNGFQPGTLKVVKNEEEIFALLGFPYVTRSLRPSHSR